MFEDAFEGFSIQISLIVQNRGSILLFWPQETSSLNIKPGIICMLVHLLGILIILFEILGLILSFSKRDQTY